MQPERPAAAVRTAGGRAKSSLTEIRRRLARGRGRSSGNPVDSDGPVGPARLANDVDSLGSHSFFLDSFRLYTVCGRRMIGLDECPVYRVQFGGWPVFSGKWPIEDALFSLAYDLLDRGNSLVR